MQIVVDENELQWRQYPDRRSVDLIGPERTPAHAGLVLGVAVYTAAEYGELQQHDDQEAIYCVSGEGLIRIGNEEYSIYPGRAFYIGRGTPHATKRTGLEPVMVVYVHAPD